MKKTFSVNRTVEAEAVDIPEYPGYCVAYSKWSDQRTIHRTIMLRDRFDKVTRPKSPDAFKTAELPMWHQIAQRESKYHDKRYETGPIWAISPYDLENYLTHKMYPKKGPEWKVSWGDSIPDGWMLVGYAMGDGSYADVTTGKIIRRPVRDFFLASEIDIYGLLKDIESGKVTDVRPSPDPYARLGRNPISYVPGNGDQMTVDIDVPEDQYQGYKAMDHWKQREFIRTQTSLARYKRDEEESRSMRAQVANEYVDDD